MAVARNPAIHPYYIKRPVSGARATGAPWTMPNLCSRYRFPTGLAGGGVIGIVELGGGWDRSDINAFFASVGQPMPNITDVSVDGTTNVGAVAGGDASFEVALDIQVAAAAYYVATGKPATIRVYWVQDIATGLRAAVTDGCSVFSMSWGANEADWPTGTGPGSIGDMQAAAQAAITAGTIPFAASGDNDSSDGARKAAVDCPASCPSVIGCGGTTLTASSEVVWNNNPGNNDGEGTGGGYSKTFPAQAFQVGIPAAPSGLGRMVPDVASCADPNTGIEIYCQGSATVVGGTSAAAPLWAGLVAACGVKLGSVVSKFYKTPSAFTDITSGSNGAYSAAKGPDPCTGMGSPIGTTIAAVLGSTVVINPPPPPPPPPTGTAPSFAPVTAAQAALDVAVATFQGEYLSYIAAQVRRGQPPQGQEPPRPIPEPLPGHDGPWRGGPGRGGRS